MTPILIALTFTIIGGIAGTLRANKLVADLRTLNARNLRYIDQLHDRFRDRGRELAELRAWKSARLAPLKAANAKRHAESLEREAKATQARNKVNAELRALTEGLI